MSFVYNANALAFGGALKKPCCDIIPSQASVVLAPSGGEGSHTIRNFNYKGIVTFDEASVYVAGSQNGPYRNTVATALIRNLNLMNMVHIELLCARVTSEHLAVDDQDESPCEEPEFTFEGSIIDNVRIAGRPTKITLDHSVFSRYPKHSDFVKAFEGLPAADEELHGTARAIGTEKTLAECYSRRFGWAAENCANGAPEKRGVIRCSLVDDIPDIPNVTDEDFSNPKTRRANDKKNPVRRNGYIVRIADFGTIAIGEVILKEQQRTVNMLRFNLGSPIDGSGTACSGTTNGSEMVP
jgi:hypothetical protein